MDLHGLKHIAVVMDGNGRWANQRGAIRIEGHKAGVKATRAIVQYASAQGLPCLSLFAFSSENWKRPRPEVNFLFDLFTRTLKKYLQQFHQENIKLVFSGDRSAFTAKFQQTLAEAETLTQDNRGMILNIAFNYGGRWDIVEASKKIAQQCTEGQLNLSDINEATFANALNHPELPDVDMCIRTSGEYRISNFFLWQAAYSELYFCDVLWPDFSESHFSDAVNWYGQRNRRFGNIA